MPPLFQDLDLDPLNFAAHGICVIAVVANPKTSGVMNVRRRHCCGDNGREDPHAFNEPAVGRRHLALLRPV